MSNKKKQDKPKEEYLNYLEPLLSRPEKMYANSDWTKPRTHVFVMIAIAAVVSAAAFFFPLPQFEWVWVTLGVVLGALLFIPAYFAVTKKVEERKKIEPDYLSLKERNSPTQRLRLGIGSFVVVIVVIVALFTKLPSIVGGILAVAMSLGIYSFIQRTKYEFNSFLEGEIDPRDLDGEVVEDEEEDDEAKAEAARLETKEYLELINSLPEEQRALLTNPKLNGAMAILNEDDKKGSKKGGLFGKKGK